MSRTMKDSGIDWIGSVPFHWSLKRAKYVFRQSSSKGNTNLVLLSATQDRGVVDKSTLDGVVQVAESADLNTFKTVHINDFVISLRSFQGGFEISHCEGVISPAYTVFRLREGDYVGYYRYLFKSVGFIDKINSLTVGIREGKNIQYEDFSNMLIPILPITEQQSIADFLDKKCREIDEMISLQEKIIEELKVYKQSVITEAVCKGLNPNVPMKDSGIEWIGQIPTDWGTIRVRFVFGIIGGNGFKDELQGQGSGDYPFYKTSDLNGTQPYISDSSNYVSQEVAIREKYNIIPRNAIIVSKIGAALYKNHRRIASQECCIDNNLEALLPLRNDCIKYLFYLLKCIDFGWFDNKGTVPSVNNAKLKDLYIPDIPSAEQQPIADYLDEKCAKIDTLISVKQSKVDTLKEYKKSVIYEYITGKKEIPAL